MAKDGAGDGHDDWVARSYAALQSVLEEAIQVLVKDDKPKTQVDVEKLARCVGVVARAVKAVDALKARPKTSSQTEDEMSDSDSADYEPGERERLLAELERNTQRLERVLERKQAEAAERRAARDAQDREDDAGAASPPVSTG